MSRPSSRHGCSGYRSIPRRNIVLSGVCGALGLTLTDLLRSRAVAAADGHPEPKAQSIIHLNLGGGFSGQESWDPKPEAPTEYRGPYNVLKTNTGEFFSDTLARTAKVADRFTVVRSVVGRIPDHGQATYHTFTGYLPTTVIDYPQMGSVVSRHFGSRKDMPPYVAIPALHGFTGGTGYLSSKYGAFQLNADPGGRGEFRVKDFSIPDSLSQERFERRRAAREIVEQNLKSRKADVDQLNTMDEFYQRAYTLLSSSEAQAAFAIKDEPQAMHDLYGNGYILKYRNQPAAIGGRLLLARRLVAAGVRFVTVNYNGWDSHVDIKGTCDDKMPALDHAISGLITDLDQRGMLDSTLVLITSEFGRTPKINQTNGRDHWARVYPAMLAGGGITRGQIYGASDATASEPARDAVTLEDLLYTVYHLLGIDANQELLAFGTRPIEMIKGGKLIGRIIA